MSRLARFDFGHSFETPRPASVQEETPPITDADVEAAFARGRETGIEEARAETANAIAQIEGRLALAFADFARRHAETLHAGKRAAVEMALGAVAKQFPTWAKREGLAEVEAVLEECMAKMAEEPRLVVRVPELLLDSLTERLDEIKAKAGFRGTITLFAEPGFGPADCRIEWADGGAERDGRRLDAEIREAARRVVAAEAPKSNL